MSACIPLRISSPALTRTVVLLVRRLIVACGVGLDSLLDLLNGAAQEVCLAHFHTFAGLSATAASQRRPMRMRVAWAVVQAGAMEFGASAGQWLGLAGIVVSCRQRFTVDVLALSSSRRSGRRQDELYCSAVSGSLVHDLHVHGQGANPAPRFARPSAVGPPSHLRVLRAGRLKHLETFGKLSLSNNKSWQRSRSSSRSCPRATRACRQVRGVDSCGENILTPEQSSEQP